MLAIKGSWVGRTYALSKSNESGGRKARIRRSKEERKGMVELFIKKYQSLHNGNFPSLTLTQKEVGGTFYTVREIVREIIQENRVLGPGKVLPEDQDSHEWSDQYPLGTISTEPQSSSALIPDGNVLSPDQHQSSLQEFSSTYHGHVSENQKHKAEAGQDINGSFVIVGDVESHQEKVHELQQKDNEVGPTEDIIVGADPSIDDAFVNPVFSEVQVGESLGNHLCLDEVGNSVTEINSLEVKESYEQMEAKVEDQAIAIQRKQPCSDELGNSVEEINSLEVEESYEQMEAIVEEQTIRIQNSDNVGNAVIDSQVVAEGQDMGTAETDNEVGGSVVHSPSSEVEASREQLQAENVVKQPEDSVCADNSVKVVGSSSSRPKVFQTEDVVVETFPLRPIVSRTDGNGVVSGSNGTWERKDAEKVESGPSKDGSSSSVVDDLDNGQISLLGKKSVTADEQAIASGVAATMDGSDSGEVKSKLSNDQVSSVKNIAENSTLNHPNRISDNKGSVERSRDGQKRRDPTLERINMSWQGSSNMHSPAETNPLLEALRAVITSFVKFWTKKD